MIDRFVSTRQARWDRLSVLVQRAKSVRRRISVEEIDELVRLYRRTSGDLALAQRDFPSDPVTQYLNQLESQAYGLIYRTTPTPLSTFRRFFTHDFPAEVRSIRWYLLVSALLFFVPLIVTAIALIIAPEGATLILPDSLVAGIKDGKTWFDMPASEAPYVSAFIMTNNMQASGMAFVGGMLAGVGTVFVLLNNGITIGAIVGALLAYGLGDRLVGFVSPHGFIELSMIVLSGACGLMLGRAILRPGLLPRTERIGTAAMQSARLFLGSLPFLIIAGLLEGFVSPRVFPWPFKLAIGLLTAVLLYSYLLFAGRSKASLPIDPN